MTCCNHDCRQGRDCPTTRKHPRTLQEAFGPYARDDFEEAEPFAWAVTIALAVLLVSILAAAVAVYGP